MKWFLAFALVAAPVLMMTGCKSSAPISVPGMSKVQQKIKDFRTSDEEQIAVVLDDVSRGMQSRRIYKVLAYVSHSYHDEEGRDYAGIEAYLNDMFKRYREIRITRAVPRITLYQDNSARAVETFGTVAEPVDPNSEPPVNLQGQVTVTLVKVEGQWQILEWGRLL